MNLIWCAVTCVCSVVTLSPRDYDAVLFDLDGVPDGAGWTERCWL